MPGWNQFPVRTVLSQHLGCPVLVDNDVNIMALGEMHAGLARTVDDLLFVKVGTGVGCGIIVDGSVYRAKRVPSPRWTWPRRRRSAISSPSS
jgi:predicted NBD/HSP70 family sugar kinase